MTGRSEFLALFSLLTALTALSLDAILPAMPAMARDLGATGSNSIQLVVTLFILGMVGGELTFGPLSDAWGRKPAILLGLLLFCTGALVALTADSMAQMIAGRILQGVGVSGPKIGARAVIRDRFQGDAMAQAMSVIFTVLILVPMLAPLLGQTVQAAFGWRAIFALYLLAAGSAALWLTLRQPETLPEPARIPIAPRTLARNIRAILRHRGVMAFTAIAGLVFGAQLLFLSLAQSLIGQIYGKAAQFPLWFALLALGMGAASFVNARLVMRLGMMRLLRGAIFAMAGISALLIALALPFSGVPPFGVFLVGFLSLFACIGIVFGNVNALAMQWLGQMAGLGASLIASLSSAVAVVLSVGLGALHQATIYPAAAGFLTAAVAGIFILKISPASNLAPVSHTSPPVR